MMKTTRHSLMAKGIMVLLSLLVLIFAFTYSWYIPPDTPVSASGITGSGDVSSADFLYAVGFSTSETGFQYKHTAFTNDDTRDLDLQKLYIDDPGTTFHNKEINLLHDYTPIDVTGNGVDLIRPAMNYGNWSINTSTTNYSIAEPNEQYVSFDLIFKSENANTTIKLEKDSFALGKCETFSGDGKLLTDTASRNEGNKYGTFSKDAIVGAVRVAFLNYADNAFETAENVVTKDSNAFQSKPKLLWIPRPDLFLNNGAISADSTELSKDLKTEGWTLDQDVTSATKPLYSQAMTKSDYSTYEHYYYDIINGNKTFASYADAKASVLDADVSKGTANRVVFGDSADVVTLTYPKSETVTVTEDGVEKQVEKTYYYGKVRVRIWVEGTDSEARRALSGGQFSVTFHFTG